MSKKLLLWGSTVLFPLPLVVVLNVELPDASSVKYAISLGIIAYSWWLLGILLSIRPSWLDRQVGLPSIYALHGVLALLTLIPAYLHRQNTFAPNRLAMLLGDWAFYAVIVIVCHAILFLSGWLTDRSRIAHRVKAVLEVVFRHQLTIWMHRATIVIVLLIWLHVHIIERVNQHFAFMTLFDLYTVTVLGFYVWKKWLAPHADMIGTVVENLALNGSTRKLAIALETPSAAARAGDFYFLRVRGPRVSSEPHPFSATDDRQDQLTFTIRDSGDFTKSIGHVPTGTTVHLEGPYGRFAASLTNTPSETPLILIGMGAGVAPLLSLAAANRTSRPIHLLWSIKRAEDAYYSDLLEQYEKTSGGRFRFTVQIGRFRRDRLQALLNADEISRGRFFVVGPNPAVLSTQRLLRSIGIGGSRVEQERLTL